MSKNGRQIWSILSCVILAIGTLLFVSISFNSEKKSYSDKPKYEYDEKLSDYQNESAEKEFEQREKSVREKRKTIEEDKGLYATDSIVLSDTTKEEAERIANIIGARVRTTDAGDFAVLYLPEGVTIDDIYGNDEYKSIIPKMTPDYVVSTSTIDSYNGTILNDDNTSVDSPETETVRKGVIDHRPDIIINDPGYDSQLYLDYLNIKDTWNKASGDNVKVAIIDTGIDTDHPEFEGRISSLSYNASDDKTVADFGFDVIEDEQGHGTAVAGVLAASMNNGVGITGIAPNAELVVIKCEAKEDGNFVRGSDLVFGIAYSIEADVDVINMSFGTKEDIFSKYIDLANDSDIACIAAAGNDGTCSLVYPAAYENVIGVGAYDPEKNDLASYSNYGDNLDFVAPGTTYTTDLNGGYAIKTGTSLSAPIVTGALALYISGNEKADCDTYRQLLEASSIDLGPLGEDFKYGFGELDINALVCEEKGLITYDMMTDELENLTQIFVRGHAVQTCPEPERQYTVIDSWCFDMHGEDVCEPYNNMFTNDVTLYAYWINEDDGTAYTYTTLGDGSLRIDSYTGKRRYLTVPSEIDGKTVTSIGENAFESNSRIRSICLPDTITEIGSFAFSKCTKLSKINLPDNVKTIGEYAFDSCVRLDCLDISSSSKLVEIGNNAFSNSSIISINIPAGLKTIGKYAFSCCYSLKTISVSESNSYYLIKNNALYNKDGNVLIYYPTGRVGSYTIDESTRDIQEGAFEHSLLSEIIIPEGVINVGKYAFEYSDIKAISIPSSIATIGEGFCLCCNNLKNVVFPANGSFNEIPSFAFFGANQLDKITIPSYIERINSSAFMNSGINTVLFEKNSKLKTIGESAFCSTSLTEICIPDSVETIEDSTFSTNFHLRLVSFGDESKLTKIMSRAFSNDVELTEILIPDSVTHIGDCAFSYSGLRSISLGANLNEIGKGIVCGCDYIANIDVSEDNQYYSAYEGVLFDKNKTKIIMYPSGKSGTYILPNSVKEICDSSFAGAKNLSDIELNNGLEIIGNSAFSGCKSIESLVFPDSLVEIGERAFCGCISIDGTVVITKNVISIGRYAFNGTKSIDVIDFADDSKLGRIGYAAFFGCGMEDITIPGSVNSMGQEAFSECDNLLVVTFGVESRVERIPAWSFAGASNLQRITFEDESSLTTIEARAFEGLVNLNTIDFSGCKKLKSIDNYAFKDCPSLVLESLPNSVTEIGRYAFTGCSSMNRLSIPNNVSHIGGYAFAGTNEIELYFKAFTLPERLDENWDCDVKAYYLGDSQLIEDDEWIYMTGPNNTASIISYKGQESTIDLNDFYGYNVVAIGGGAFENNTSLTNIMLPDTLTTIMRNAFKGTTSLTSVEIPDSVTAVESEAFADSGISSVVFSANSELKSIGSSAFRNTSNLKSISIPEGVTAIKDNTFSCSGVTSVVLPEGLDSIGREAFFEAKKIKDITLPSSLKEISYKAFKDATLLNEISISKGSEDLVIRDEAFYNSGVTKVSLPENTYYIGNLCFSRCSKLSNIEVAENNSRYYSEEGLLYYKGNDSLKLLVCPAGKTGECNISENVTSFGIGAFEGSKLSKIIIPDNSKLSTIGLRTFYNCENLSEINIPKSVQSIDYYAFSECKNLEIVDIKIDSELNGIYEGAFYNCSKIKTIVIPNRMQEISEYAFYGCTALSTLIFNDDCQLRGIYDHAFEGTSIENFVMPKNMIEVGDYAFSGVSLKTLTFNNVITDIGEKAFANTGLYDTKSIKLPTSLRFIGKNAFENITDFEELELPFLGSNGVYKSFSSDGGLQYLFGNNYFTKLKKATVLGGDYVPSYCFDQCHSLEEVYLSDSIFYIGSSAIDRCPKLKSINLPINLITIDSYAFSYDENLEDIVIPTSCKTIGNSAFAGCKSLTSINIPSNISSIGDSAFEDCENLASVEVDKYNKYYKSMSGILYNYDVTKMLFVPPALGGDIVLPEGLEEIGSGAFYNNKNITSIITPGTLKTIGSRAFYCCEKLENVTLNDGLKTINYGAFCGCNSLTDFVVPDTVTVIWGEVFENCSNLKNIKLSSDLRRIGRSCFEGTAIESIVIPDKIKVFDGHQDDHSYGLDCDMFKDCKNLISVTLPDGLTEIGPKTFSGCSKLGSVYIPKGVNKIGEMVFDGCDSLENVIVDPDNQSFCSQDGIVYDKEKTRMVFVPDSISGRVEIIEGIKIIDEYQFNHYEGITDIILPDSVEEIGDNAFSDCTSLKNVSFGNGIKIIGCNILDGTPYYYNLENYQNGVLYVGEYAICRNFIPDGDDGAVLRIKDGTVLVASDCFRTHFEDKDFNVMSYDSYTELYMPDSLKYIGNRAFGSSELNKVRWSKNLELVGEGAFCSNKIKSINLDSNNLTVKRNKMGSIPHIFTWGTANIDYCRVASDVYLEIGTTDYEMQTFVGYSGAVKAKNIVLENEKQVDNIINNFVEGETIYTRTSKGYGDLESKASIYNNPIYYAGEWNLASFYLDDMIVSLLPFKNGEILRAPTDSQIKQYLPDGAEFVGWDIDGDGGVDSLPTTLSSDLVATAIYNSNISEIDISTETTIKVGESKTMGITIKPYAQSFENLIRWRSDDENVVSVQNGVITGVSEGSAIVTAFVEGNETINSVCSVTVTQKSYGIKLPENKATICKGDTYQLTPDVYLEDGVIADLTYQSDNEGVATVDSNGLITANATGNATITVSVGGFSCDIQIRVIQPLQDLSLKEFTGVVNVDETIQVEAVFTPEDTTDSKNVIWRSEDSAVASVDNKGVITGIAPGTTIIKGYLGNFVVEYLVDVKSPIKKIIMNTPRGTLRLDKTKQLDVVYVPENTTDEKSVVWSTENADIATVDENGLVTGLTTGKTVITATVGEHTATYNVSVIGLRDHNTGITVTNADDTEMEEGTNLAVEDVSGSTSALARNNLLAEIRGNSGQVYDLYIYDISLSRGDDTVQPDTTVDVDIPIPQDASDDAVLYWMEDDDTFTDMNLGDGETGYYRFQTDHFSKYALAIPKDEYEAAEVVVNTDVLSMCKGNDFDIDAQVLPEKAADKSLSYISNDEDIITVSENGKIVAVGEGTATVRVLSAVEGVEGIITVTVANHDYQNVEGSAIEPTCTTAGKELDKKCSRCNDVIEGKEIPALGHSMKPQEAVDATCETAGNSAYWSCSRCNKYFSDAEGKTEIDENSWIIPATGHDMTEHEAKEATCETAGNSAYWSCSRCNKYFSDAEGKKEIEENSWIIPATGHDYGTLIAEVPATCTDDGMKAHYECSACHKLFVKNGDDYEEKTAEEMKIDALGHDMTEHEAKEVTCETAGNSAYWSCSRCNKYFSDAEGKTEIEKDSWIIPATGHDYGELIAEVPATCTEDGMKAHYKCSVCHKLFVKDGNDYVEKTAEELKIAATGHKYDQEVVKEEYLKNTADCTHAAVYYKSCKCGAKGTETFEHGNALGHDMTEHEAKEVTCETAGNSAYWSCSRCNKYFSDAEGKTEIDENSWIIPATGHDYGNLIEEVPATCTDDGVKAHYECSACHKLFVKNGDDYVEKTAAELKISATGHKYDQEKAEEEYLKSEADCTHVAVYYKSCSCGEKGTETFENGNPLGHDMTEHEAKEVTCETDGNSAYWSCSRCKKFFSDAEGKTEIDENSWIIPATGHDYGDLIAEVPATCTDDGVKAHYECSACHKLFVKDGDDYVEKTAAELKISATGHKYDQEVVKEEYLKNATDCTHPAVYYKSCKCGAKGTETFEHGNALGHDMTEHEAKEVTCETAGNSAYWSCSRCKKFFSDAEGKTEIEENSWIIPATGHDYGTLIAEVPATCTDDGMKAHYECSVCHKLFVKDGDDYIEKTAEDLKIEAKGHKEETLPAVDPSCTVEGLSEGKRCSVCGEILVPQTKTSPALGHKWEVVKTEDATCKKEGYKLCKCSVCGEEQETIIQRKAHTPVIDAAVDPTTTSEGLTAGKHCSVCGEILVRQQVIPKLTPEKQQQKYSNEWVDGKWYDENGNQTYSGRLMWANNTTGWWVEDTDGWYPTDSWQKIDGVWYYFKPDGYMAMGEYFNGYWFNADGSWDEQYFLSWKSNSSGWWVEDISGWWPSNSWLKIDNYWYYFNSSGYMVTSQYVDGYWISSDGVCY